MAKKIKTSVGVATLGLAGIVGLSGASLLGVGASMFGVPVLGVEQASAACGYGVFAESFYAPCNNGERVDGAIEAALEETGGKKIMKITLNNYRGSGIYWECCGTCADANGFDKVVVELVGNNAITEKDGTGIAFNDVEFTGTGKLTIEAMVPVGGRTVTPCGDRSKPVYEPGIDNAALGRVLGTTIMEVDLKNNTVTEKPAETPVGKPEETEKPEDGVENEVDEALEKIDEEMKWTPELVAIHVAAAVYIVLSAAFLILLGVKKLLSKRAPKETKKIVIEEDEVVTNETGPTEVIKTETTEKKSKTGK